MNRGNLVDRLVQISAKHPRIWNLLSLIHKVVFPGKVNMKKYHKLISNAQGGNDFIAKLFDASDPFMASRFGSAELACIAWYLQKRKNRKNKAPYKQSIRTAIRNNAGVFPETDQFLDRWSDYFVSCIRDIDVLGVWYNRHENTICKNYCTDAFLTELRGLEPFYHENPWSMKLEGKKILVVHPFADSILKNYSCNRTHLFPDMHVLPLFELKTIKAIQSIAYQKTEFDDWFSALDYMQEKISTETFDAAIIGAGAYGLPLASFCKRLDRKAVHIGGGTQILFGIRGKRFDGNPDVSKWFNEYWIRPSEAETPENFKCVEDGCYW